MEINNKQIRPMPGRCYVRLESLFRNTGSIVIPNAYKTAPHIIGTVEDYNCHENDIRRLGHRLTIGERVITSHHAGRLIQDSVYDYSIKDILAIVFGDVNLKSISQDIERCRYCGNAKTGTDQAIILLDGRCLRCGKDKWGVGQPANKPVSVSDAECEEHEEMIYKKNPNRQKKIFIQAMSVSSLL